MKWCKMAADFDLNPKAVAAGRAGREVFLFALRCVARRETDGTVPHADMHACYVSRILGITEAEAEAGLQAALDAELLHDDGSDIHIVGWDDEWRPPLSSTERSRRHRAKCNGKGRRATKGDGEGTVGDGCNERDAIEESRVDKKRVEDLSLSEVAPRTRRGPEPPQGNGEGNGKSKKRGPSSAEVASVAAEAVAGFNDGMGRRLSPSGYHDQVRRLLGKRYTPAEIKAVVWWAIEEWGDSEEWRRKIDPGTLWKLQSSHGSRTFPQYLSCATERWLEQKGTEPPWLKHEA